jgi:hypothetical protein
VRQVSLSNGITRRPDSVSRKLGVPEAALFVLLGGLGTALMTNVGSLMLGYGLVYAVMLYAVWRFTPKSGALMVLGAELVALPIYVGSSAVFVSIALTNVAVRPLIVFLAAMVYRRAGNRAAGALALTVIETVLALSVDAGLFQSDQAGFAIYGILLAPFVYLMVVSAEWRGVEKTLGLAAGTASLLAYYFAFFAFAVLTTGALAVISMGFLFLGSKAAGLTRRRLFSSAALVMVILGFALGGTQLRYNLGASLYPLNPHSWDPGSRWEQASPSLCPATQNVFASTWSPTRLRLVSTCTTVLGTAGELITAEDDGDYTFDLEINSTYSGLLSLSDLVLEKGELHVEVVPADQHQLLDPMNGGICPGDLLSVTGALVIDTDHGMGSEIHPAMAIKVLNHSGSGLLWPACVVGRSGLEPGA